MKIPFIRKKNHGTAVLSFLTILILLPFFLHSLPLHADYSTAEKREMLLAIEKACELESDNYQQKMLCQRLIKFKRFLSSYPLMFSTSPPFL